LDLKIHPLNPLNLVHGFVAELPSSFICGFMNSLYSVFKFLVGFLLAIVLMAGASVAAALYFAAKLTTVPERPVFPNDKTPVQIAGAAPKSTAQASPVSTSSDAPSPKPLEPGAYRALVTQPIGLILRDTGSRDSNRIGGVGYKEKVVVLEESPDKEWQRIRVEDGNREGWVKGGNTEKLRANRWAKRQMRRGGDGETKGNTVKFISIFLSKSVSCPSFFFLFLLPLPSRSLL
jgi:hypothetical protein